MSSSTCQSDLFGNPLIDAVRWSAPATDEQKARIRRLAREKGLAESWIGITSLVRAWTAGTVERFDRLQYGDAKLILARLEEQPAMDINTSRFERGSNLAAKNVENAEGHRPEKSATDGERIHTDKAQPLVCRSAIARLNTGKNLATIARTLSEDDLLFWKAKLSKSLPHEAKILEDELKARTQGPARAQGCTGTDVGVRAGMPAFSNIVECRMPNAE